jgi:hypothetical protein
MTDGTTGRPTDDQRRTCMVCDPPERIAGRFKRTGGDLSKLSYCGRHGPRDLRRALEAER